MDEAVLAAATRFRSALQKLHNPNLGGLAKFPGGSCGDASRLLAQYLRDSGLGDWAIVSGYRYEPFATHAWLELDGVVLDITGDQFDDVEAPVILSRTSAWHHSWESHVAQQHGVGLGYYSEDSGARRDYENVLLNLFGVIQQ